MNPAENFDAYAPDFAPYSWTDAERKLLEPFVTDLDGLVAVLRNLPPEIAGALCSRASRASGSLVEVLLKEYFHPIINGEDKKLAKELEETVTFLRDHGFKNILNNQRAQAFYAKWLSQYGDDSIAQMTGTHVVFWGISQVMMKFVEDQRIGLEPIEKSTRYVNYGNKIGGRHLYYVPKPDLERIGLFKEYTETLDHLFDTYLALLPELMARLKANYEERESILEKKAFDTLRGLLPMATLSQVAFRGNAQALEYLLNRMTRHPLGELRWYARELKRELDKEIPSLLLRTADEKSREYQEYLNARYGAVREFVAKELHEAHKDKFFRAGPKPEVKLVEYDADAEEKVVAGILFRETHGGWEEALQVARSMKQEVRKKLLSKYLLNRQARWWKTGRAFENSYLRFEIIMDAGAYRDLQRHRMMTQERQRFSAHHGYNVPREITESGLAAQFEEALVRAGKLFGKIEAHDPELAQYAVPMAYRMRFYQWQNFRALFWETELRTISQGHPDYRFIEHEKYRLVKEKFPLLGEFMLVDTNDYAIARRGTEEKIAAKEKEIVEKLGKKSQINT
ncbi:MAG: FAD-dependent thymidylate synthase [Candidatus Liptonbacteria bacterium]|nr:FAD-dependent thymidylate synthase [Candidatus Liptonbacteria bacterium]